MYVKEGAETFLRCRILQPFLKHEFPNSLALFILYILLALTGNVLSSFAFELRNTALAMENIHALLVVH